MSWLKIATISLMILGLLLVSLTFQVWAAAFLGVLFALCLNGPAEWFRCNWKMPAWAGTVLTMLIVLTVLAGLGFLIGPPLVGQADVLATKLPVAMEKSVDWMKGRAWGRTAVRHVESYLGMAPPRLDSQGQPNDGNIILTDEDAASERSDPGNENVNSEENGEEKTDATVEVRAMIIAALLTMAKMLTVTVWAILLVLVSFVITIYVALNPEVYRRGILWLVPEKYEKMSTLTMARMSIALRWWMLGRLCSMLAIGVLTSLGMWMIGMPAPLALGALAGLLSFVPNLGPIIASVPGLLLAVPEGPWMLFYVVAVYVGAQAIESNLITPLVDQYTVKSPPAVLIFSQVIMAVLFGMWGVLVAPPLLVVAMVLIQQLYVREGIHKPIEVIGTTEDEEPKGMNDDPEKKC